MKRKETEICEFEMDFKKYFCRRSNLSNDGIISQRQGLKMDVKNNIFLPEMGSGFGEPGGTPHNELPGVHPQIQQLVITVNTR